MKFDEGLFVYSCELGLPRQMFPRNRGQLSIMAARSDPEFFFLPQFVEPTRGSVSTQLIVLGSIMKAVILGVESVIALASGTIGAWLARCTQLVRWQERVTGAVLIGLSVGLLSMGGGAALSRAA